MPGCNPLIEHRQYFSYLDDPEIPGGQNVCMPGWYPQGLNECRHEREVLLSEMV